MAAPIIYGIGTGLMNLLRAGRLAQGARTAYQGTKAFGARTLGTTGAGLSQGSSGTGLIGLMARGAKRFPGTTGATEAGTGLLLGGEGVGDIMEGYQEGDIPQVLTGIGALALGTPLASRGLRLAGSQRKLRKKFPQTAEAMQKTGAEFSRRIPKGTAAVGFGALGTGLAGDYLGLGVEPTVLGEPLSVDEVVKAIEQDKTNQNIDINSNEYKQMAKEALTQAYQYESKEGVEQKQTLEQLTQPYLIQSQAPGSNTKIVDESKFSDPKDNLETMTAGEIKNVAERQDNTAKAGAKIKDDANTKANAEEAEMFNKFYNKIQNLTGGNDQTNNLILMKLASGLMTGKTGQTGFRGFLDVLGQAGNDTVDTAMALYTKEKDRRNDLAVAFLKSQEKKTLGRAVTGSRKRVTVDVPTTQSPFGIASRTVDYFKDDGTTAMFAPVYAEDGKTIIAEQAIPMPYSESKPIQGSAAQEAKLRTQLDNTALAYEMTKQVLAMPNSAYGLAPKIKGFTEDAIGSLESVGSMFGYDLGGPGGEADQRILSDIINAPLFDPSGQQRSYTAEEAEEAREIAAQYNKEIQGILGKIRPGEKELDLITKAELIQTRLKYIVANANKAEDRLTQKDIENAEATTKIVGFKSPRAVRAAYQNLQGQLNQGFEGIGRRYISAGGTNEYIIKNFSFMPFIADWANQINKVEAQKAVEGQQLNVIGTIK